MIYHLKRISIFFLLLFCGNVFSQSETNNWYFGDEAGLNFANARVTKLTDGKMSTLAGCSTISDNNGNLLFYTNGQSIWNKNHVIMDNGNGLAGEINNTQTSIIVPNPTDETKYYIFTTRGQPSSSPLVTSGLFYSEVEISSTYPLGKVVLKNRRLTTTTTGRITAIHDVQNNMIKVIAFGSLPETNSNNNTFYVFDVTQNGVILPAHKTTIPYNISSEGAMKISPDGKFIALVDYENRHFYLYSFNMADSSISLAKHFHTDLLLTPFNPYGVAFSQDSKVVFFTAKNIKGNYCILFRYAIDVDEAKVGIAYSGYDIGSLQLARNGKIYIASYGMDHIGVINDPENINNHDFQELTVSVNPKQSFKGLPNFVQSFLRNRIITEDKCVSNSLEFSLDTYAPIKSVLWDFDDGTTSTEIEPKHLYSYPGHYIVKATIMVNNHEEILYKHIKVHPLPDLDENQTLTQCDINGDGIALFNLYNIKDKMEKPNLENQYFFYYNYSDAINDTEIINNPEEYINNSNPEELFVKIISPEGCSIIRNFFIETIHTDIEDIEEMVVCEDSDYIPNNGEGRFNLKVKIDEIKNQLNIPITSDIKFYKTLQDAQAKINILPNSYITPSSTIWLRIEDENFSCYGIEPLTLIVNHALQLNIEDNYIICDSSLQPSIILDGGIANEHWEWKNDLGNIISNNRTLSITEPGNYSLTVYKTENNILCSRTKAFYVTQAEKPTFVNLFANDNKINVVVNGESSYGFSLDNRNFFGEGTSYTFNYVEAGVHTVYVKDRNNCVPTINAKVSLIGYPKYFTPNGDGYNDIWKIHGVTSDFYSYALIHIFDRYGKNLFNMTLSNNIIGWDGRYNGEVLAPSDYWFRATLIDKENNTIEKTGHFSLIK